MSHQSEEMELENVRVVNKRDVDVVVRDFYGREHLLFPMSEKEITVFKERKADHDHGRPR